MDFNVLLLPFCAMVVKKAPSMLEKTNIWYKKRKLDEDGFVL
jgi:hypothetical protein